MNKLFKFLIVLLILFSLSACTEDTIHENNGNFSGCYYFVENGDYYDLVFEVYREDNGDLRFMNEQELYDVIAEFEMKSYGNDMPDTSGRNLCEPENPKYGISIFNTTGINNEKIDMAAKELKNFEFQISMTKENSFNSVIYSGTLDYIK